MGLRPLVLIGATALLLGGCVTSRYYTQVVSGHLDLMRRAAPIEAHLAREDAPAALKAKLQTVLRMREFSSRELGLPDNGSYKRYADLERPFALWNVIAAPEFSLQPVISCFPFAGCVSYRGYFSEADAQSEATLLREQGYDVFVGGVPAYSTLGWFDDPVLSTFIQYPEAELARLMFHELAHQVLYVKDDSVFNESFAATVEEAGVERWLAANGKEGDRPAYERWQSMKRQFIELVLKYRGLLGQYYRQDLPADEKRRGKAAHFAAMEREYQELKASWGGFAGYDRWFAAKPNNAALVSVSLYNDLVPALRALLTQEDGDLPRFYAAARTVAALPRAERDAALARIREAAHSRSAPPSTKAP